jgi:hypothetical protein
LHYKRINAFGSYEVPFNRHAVKELPDGSVEVNGFIFDANWGEWWSYISFHDAGGGRPRAAGRGPGRFLYSMMMDVKTDRKNIVVDHINGNPRDNRICNLRVTSQSENCLNRGVYVDASISYHSRPGRRKRWCAHAWDNWKVKNLGYFMTREEAVEARRKYLIENGYRILGEKRED